METAYNGGFQFEQMGHLEPRPPDKLQAWYVYSAKGASLTPNYSIQYVTTSMLHHEPRGPRTILDTV